MIECIRDDAGNIVAVCEWLLFKDGELDETGNVMFIGELEINKGFRGNGVIRKITKSLYDKNPQATHVCFFRKTKYPDRDSRAYTREQITKLLGG
jgi:hypothetical protein